MEASYENPQCKMSEISTLIWFRSKNRKGMQALSLNKPPQGEMAESSRNSVFDRSLHRFLGMIALQKEIDPLIYLHVSAAFIRLFADAR